MSAVPRRKPAWSEDRLHAWLARRFGRSASFAGSRQHDAACLRARPGRPALCADQTIEGVHFERGTPARQVGRKAAARALSDLAATAARPRALLLSLTAPELTPESHLRALIEGCAETAERFGAELVGGDLACSPGPLVASVAAYGLVPGRARPPGRDRARAGDVVLLSGPVGGSRLGRHLRFEPRVKLGQALFVQGARCLMDVSDGLARDLARIAQASGVRIDLEHVPVHRDARRLARTSGRAPRWHALHDGEDHELIASLPRAAWQRSQARLRREAPRLVRIGSVRKGRGLYLATEEGGELRIWSGKGGWVHGA